MRLIKCNVADALDAACWNIMNWESWHAWTYYIVSLLFGASPVVLFWAHSVSSWASQSKKGNIVIIPQWSQKGEASKTELHATTNNSFLLNSWHIWAIQSSPKPSQTCAKHPHRGRRSCPTPTPDPERPPVAWAHDAGPGIVSKRRKNDGDWREPPSTATTSAILRHKQGFDFPVHSRDRMGPLFFISTFFWRVCHVIPG